MMGSQYPIPVEMGNGADTSSWSDFPTDHPNGAYINSAGSALSDGGMAKRITCPWKEEFTTNRVSF